MLPEGWVLNEAHWKGVPDTALCEYLIRTIIFNDPLAHAIFRSPTAAWNNLPTDKSLLGSEPECGLPIGNLTSQLFANVYLNALDHFIKRDLGIRCYGRYVDDMVLIHSDKQVLLDAIESIRFFLKERLHLILHPRKIRLQPASRGFSFLGAYLLPYRCYPGKRIVKNYRQCLANPCQDQICQSQRIKSYRGLLEHFNCRSLLENC